MTDLGPEERLVLDAIRNDVRTGGASLTEPILRALQQLGVEGDAVAERCAERLRLGQQQYGLLDLAHDKRNFLAEVVPELLDALVYVQCAEVQRRVREPSEEVGGLPEARDELLENVEELPAAPTDAEILAAVDALGAALAAEDQKRDEYKRLWPSRDGQYDAWTAAGRALDDAEEEATAALDVVMDLARQRRAARRAPPGAGQ